MRLQPLSDDALGEVSALALNAGFDFNGAAQNNLNNGEIKTLVSNALPSNC